MAPAKKVTTFVNKKVVNPPLKLETAAEMDTKYVHMLVGAENIARPYKILAYFSTWILLSGFLMAPGTFTGPATPEEVAALGSGATKHMNLLVGAWVSCSAGSIGIFLLFLRWHANYLWVHDALLLPGLLNSLAGLLSSISSASFSNVLPTDSEATEESLKMLGTSDAGADLTHLTIHSPLAAYSKLIVTFGFVLLFLVGWAFYKMVLIRRMKDQHNRVVRMQ
ncbi:hypothetical protein MKEN_01018300 [Mycena kentingensis (nom. inval.)]|nr:hypothetical protein MKEN_01018300 [Mycena kentingensis (nom. inval.)]